MKAQFDKPWKDLTPENVARLGGETGIYQLADETGRIVKTAYAGGRSLFGLRGELQKELEAASAAPRRFRVEVNAQYMSRYYDVLRQAKG
jgi:hypothetical protein